MRRGGLDIKEEGEIAWLRKITQSKMHVDVMIGLQYIYTTPDQLTSYLW